MCLGIPMKILRIDNEWAVVETGRLRRTVNIQMVEGLKAGDYVVVHAGFAIEKVDPVRARQTLKIIDEIR